MKKKYIVWTVADQEATKRATFMGAKDCRYNLAGAMNFVEWLIRGGDAQIIVTCGKAVIWGNCFFSVDFKP